MSYRDPTEADLKDPLWNAIWREIKTWDVNVPAEYGGYCGATGNHVSAIYDAVRSAEPAKEAVTALCPKCGHTIFHHSASNGCTHYVESMGAECGCSGPAVTAPTPNLSHILERDRTKVAECVTAVKKELKAYDWLIEGRGSYEWNDDRWHEEFKRASEAISTAIEPLVRIAADWSNCPKTDAEVQEARSGPVTAALPTESWRSGVSVPDLIPQSYVAAQSALWAEYLEHVCSCDLPHFTCFFHTKFGEALKGKEASGYTGELAKWVAAGQVAYWEGIGDAPLFPRSQPDLRALNVARLDELIRECHDSECERDEIMDRPRCQCYTRRVRALESAIGAAPGKED